MKNSYWFNHDYGARNDPKLQNALFEFGGAAGFAFWVLVEMLYEQGGYLPRNCYRQVAYAAHCDEEAVKYVVEQSGLFEFDDERIWSQSQLKRQEKFMETRRKRAEAGSKGGRNRAMAEQNRINSQANAKQMLSKCQANAIAEEKRREDKREDKRIDIDSIDIESLSEVASPSRPKAESMEWVREKFNAICKDYPRVASLSEKRKNKIRLRLGEMQKIADDETVLNEVLTKMQASKFLKGDNQRGWKASFDWLFENSTNWVKVYEGNYEDRAHPATGYDINKHVNDIWDNDNWK